jgi:predicted small metal-binding protein
VWAKSAALFWVGVLGVSLGAREAWRNRRAKREGDGRLMRALDCQCGRHLEAQSDEELYRQARAHVDQDHPEMQLSDEQVMGIISSGAYDK